MASLIDTLIDTLEKENKEYESLLELGLEKTGIIIRNDVDELSRMVEKEQLVVERIIALEKREQKHRTILQMFLTRMLRP